MVGLFIEGVHAWKQSVRVLHPLAAHDVVQVTVRQQDLNRLRIEAVADALKCFSLWRGHARIDHRQRTVSVIHNIGLLSKHVACKWLHHGA